MPHTFATVVIPAAQVRSLHSAPIQLVPGSAGNLFNLYSLYLRYVYGTVAFNPVANDVLVAYTGDGTAAGSLMTYPGIDFNAVGCVDQTVDMTGYLDAWFGQTASSPDPVARPAASLVGAGLYLTQFRTAGGLYTTFPSGGADWTQGDGELIVRVEYSYLLA